MSLFVDGAAARFRKFAVLEAHRGAGVGVACCRRRRLKLQAGAATSTATRARNGRVLRKARLVAAATPPFAKYADSSAVPYATMRKPLA